MYACDTYSAWLVKTTNRHSGSAFRFVKLVCCNRIDRTWTCDYLNKSSVTPIWTTIRCAVSCVTSSNSFHIRVKVSRTSVLIFRQGLLQPLPSRGDPTASDMWTCTTLTLCMGIEPIWLLNATHLALGFAPKLALCYQNLTNCNFQNWCGVDLNHT